MTPHRQPSVRSFSVVGIVPPPRPSTAVSPQSAATVHDIAALKAENSALRASAAVPIPDIRILAGDRANSNGGTPDFENEWKSNASGCRERFGGNKGDYLAYRKWEEQVATQAAEVSAIPTREDVESQIETEWAKNENNLRARSGGNKANFVAMRRYQIARSYGVSCI